MRLLSVLFLAPLFSLPAQTLSFGLKGGFRVTDDLDSYFAASESPRSAAGAMATLGLGHGFSVEVNALYRSVGYRSFSTGPGGRDSSTIVTRGNSWEFPLLLRKAMAAGMYAAAGYTPRVIDGSGQVTLVQGNGVTLDVIRFVVPSPWETTHGLAGAIGFERRVGRLRIAPEAR